MTEASLDLKHFIGKNVIICTGRGTEEERFSSGTVESVYEAQDDDPPMILLEGRWLGIPRDRS